jgi:hypothetical protein
MRHAPGSAGEILAILRDGRPRTRRELAVLTGQARSTVVQLDAPVAEGSAHEIGVVADVSIIYMQIVPGQYVPNRAYETRTLTVGPAGTPPPVAPLLVWPTPEPRPVTETAGAPVKLGLTLYCATAELIAGQYDLRSLLARVAEAGVGPGVEIVASQMLPTYPVVSPEFERSWRSAFDAYGFVASSFSANLDMGRRRDCDMTPDEEYEFTELLFRGAKRLGFPLVRIQSAKRDLVRRLVPLAEELELRMAYEIHAPSGPNTPDILAVREVYDEVGSPLLGFVADFSSTMRAMSPTILREMGRLGLDDEALATLQRVWATDAPRPRSAGAVHRLPAGARHRPGRPRPVRPARLQHARPRRRPGVGGDHAADPPRARQVLRHRRGWQGAGDRLPGAGQGLRRGRVRRLLVQRVRGARVLAGRPGRPDRARARAARAHPAVGARPRAAG